MVFEILKVIVGGLAAFPVVQLAVWWIGRSDPLDLGPKIGAVVPIVVPQHLRNPQVEDNAVSDDSFADDRKTRDDRKAFENINERPASQGVMKGPFNSSGTDPGKKGLASNPDIDQSVASVSNSRPKLSAEELISEKEAGNRSLKSAVSSGKGSTVEEVNAAITELLNVPPIVEGQANAENQDRHFTALCSLAEKLATLQGDTAEVESAKSTAETIISQDFPRPLQASSLRAKQLWDEAPENNTGIAICGKLVKAEPRDKYYQLEVKWAHQPSESIKIYSKDAGVLKLAADSDIVALGTVVDGPSNQLPEGQFILAVLAVPVN